MTAKTLLLGLVALMGAASQAAPLPTPKTHTFSLGLEGGHAHYWNWLEDGQPLEDIGGLIGGVMADYTFTMNSYFAKIDVHAQWGKAKYSALINKSGSGYTVHPNVRATLRNVRTNMVETRLVVGKSFDVREDVRLSPFIGVGYKTFSQSNLAGRYPDSDPTVQGFALWINEDFRAHQIYLPMGMTVLKALDDTWHFSATGEVDLLLNGNSTVRYDRETAFEKVPQRNGFGLKAEMAVIRQMHNMSLSVGPYLSYWNVKKGKSAHISTAMYRTLETGLRLKVSF